MIPRLSLAAFLLASAAESWAQVSDVALGIEALARRDVRGAEAAFVRGTAAPNPLVRSGAWQWRGHVAWKFRGDTGAARTYLARALAEARDSSRILLEVARLNGARRRYRDAVQVAHGVMRRSGDAEQRGLAARTISVLSTDAAFAAPERRVHDSLDVGIVAEARDTMLSRVRRFHGRTNDAQALINLAAILADTTALDVGLRSYFALVQEPIRTRLDSAATAGAMEGLLEGRLYESLALLDRSARRNAIPATAPDGIAYGRWLHTLRPQVERVYRRQLAGLARPGDLTRLVVSEGQKLWSQLSHDLDDGRPEFYPAGFYRDLRNRFGAAISIERSGAIEELYLSHVIGELPLHSAKATLVVMEGFAGGVDDWLLDGTGGRAGWIDRDAIYQRRTGFTETPFLALLALTDPQTIPGEMLRIARDSVGDLARSRRDSTSYLPGVAARMFRDGADTLLRASASAPEFTRQLYESLVETSIVLHETRHLLDRRSGRASTPATDEFRAKIDEVTGARYPRLALTAILSPNIGDQSSHGEANRRIMIGLNRWIRQNGASIAGYEPTVPALLQLPRLTDDQLRAAFRSMRTP